MFLRDQDKINNPWNQQTTPLIKYKAHIPNFLATEQELTKEQLKKPPC